MSTSSSSSWEAKESGTVWIHGWKHSRARNPVFLQVWWLLGSPQKGLCFRGDLGKWSTKSAQDCSESLICTLKCYKNYHGRSTFGRSGPKNVEETLARVRFDKRTIKIRGPQHRAKLSPLSTLRARWSAWCNAPAEGFASGCGKTNWYSCAGKH